MADETKPNSQYPDSKPEDFSGYYAPSKSDIPWMTTNCAFCGRTEKAMKARDPPIFKEIAHIDPYSVKRHWCIVCSDDCETKMRACFRGELDTWKLNRK